MIRHNPTEADIQEADLTLRALVLPTFEARLRPSDIEDFSSRDQRLLLAVSIMEQQLGFLVQHAQAVNEHERRIEWRLKNMERWRLSLSGPIAIAVWIVSASLPFLVKQIFFQ